MKAFGIILLLRKNPRNQEIFLDNVETKDITSTVHGQPDYCAEDPYQPCAIIETTLFVSYYDREGDLSDSMVKNQVLFLAATNPESFSSIKLQNPHVVLTQVELRVLYSHSDDDYNNENDLESSFSSSGSLSFFRSPRDVHFFETAVENSLNSLPITLNKNNMNSKELDDGVERNRLRAPKSDEDIVIKVSFVEVGDSSVVFENSNLPPPNNLQRQEEPHDHHSKTTKTKRLRSSMSPFTQRDKNAEDLHTMLMNVTILGEFLDTKTMLIQGREESMYEKEFRKLVLDSVEPQSSEIIHLFHSFRKSNNITQTKVLAIEPNYSIDNIDMGVKSRRSHLDHHDDPFTYWFYNNSFFRSFGYGGVVAVSLVSLILVVCISLYIHQYIKGLEERKRKMRKFKRMSTSSSRRRNSSVSIGSKQKQQHHHQSIRSNSTISRNIHDERRRSMECPQIYVFSTSDLSRIPALASSSS